MTSFTNGLTRQATEEDCKAPWLGGKNGAYFRCRLCGYKFKVGSAFRWVFANFEASPSRCGNFLVCEVCDGEDVLNRAAKQEETFSSAQFWFLRLNLSGD
jgi:hypothetical protein